MLNRGIVVVISGPSGVGKTTLGKKLLEDPLLSQLLEKVPTYTTRKPRPGEQHGHDYIFLSKTEFAIELGAGNLLEWVEIFGNFYGTGKRELEKIWERGKIPLLIIDVRGAKYVKNLYPRAITIFIMPPSEKVLSQRLSSRKNISKEDLALRLSIAREEMQEAEHYDHVILNDDLNLALTQLKDIILKEFERRNVYVRS